MREDTIWRLKELFDQTDQEVKILTPCIFKAVTVVIEEELAYWEEFAHAHDKALDKAQDRRDALREQVEND
jgi:hypothetical protein